VNEWRRHASPRVKPQRSGRKQPLGPGRQRGGFLRVEPVLLSIPVEFAANEKNQDALDRMYLHPLGEKRIDASRGSSMGRSHEQSRRCVFDMWHQVSVGLRDSGDHRLDVGPIVVGGDHKYRRAFHARC
jgi:hypothetical protein